MAEKRGAGTYRDLVAWQKGMSLAEAVLREVGGFPRWVQFSLGGQMSRAAVSVPSNVAEGFGRRTPRQFRQFLRTALGSLFELQTQAELARRLGWLKGDALADLRGKSDETDAVLSGLLRSIKD